MSTDTCEQLIFIVGKRTLLDRDISMKNINLDTLLSSTVGFVFYRNNKKIGYHCIRQFKLHTANSSRIEAIVDLDLSTYGARHYRRHAEMNLQNEETITQYLSNGTGGELNITLRNGLAEALVKDRRIQIDISGTEFFLESNFVGFEWMFITLRFKYPRLRTWLLNVNTLQKVPYLVERIDTAKLRTNLGTELVIDEHGLISEFRYPSLGLLIKRENVPEPDWNNEPLTPKPNKPVYSIPFGARFTVEEKKIEASNTNITTFVRIPRNREPHSAVLFISGSGSQDRHGFSGELDLGTHLILDYLANNDILTLSYDDRGINPTNQQESNSEIGLGELISDAEKCLQLLFSRNDIDKNRIFILGHSEGALIAMILCSMHQVAGIALMASPFRPLDVILEEQSIKSLKWANYSEEQIKLNLSELRKYIEYIKDNKPLDFKAPSLFLTNYKSSKWIREHLALPLPEIRAKVKCRVLILNGNKDFQIHPQRDGYALANMLRQSGNSQVSFHILDNVDHLFREETEESKPSRYFESYRPISSQFLHILCDWFKI